MTQIVEWLLVVLLPVLLVSAVAKLVFVKVDARRRKAAEIGARLDTWIRASERLQSIDGTAWEQLGVESKEQGLVGRRRVLNVIRIRICRLRIAWLRLRAWPGQYLSRSRYAEIQRNRSYIRAKENEYRRHKATEWAALKKQLKTNVSLEAILGTNGWMVLLGIAVTMVATGLGWSFGALEAPRWLCIAIVVVPMGTIFLRLRNSTSMYYSLGCAVVIYVGLSTLEVGPLGNTSLKGVVDAQKVSAMFVGVAMVLSLCEVLVQVGEKHVGKFERYVIENAERATIWSQVVRPMRRAVPRVERLLSLFALTVFAASFVHFVSPLLGVTWLDGTATSRGGVGAVVVATMVVLAFPFILLVRVERAWLAGLVAMGLVGALMAGPWKPWLVTGPPKAGAVLTAYPVIRVDTSVVETRLSAEDREILTDVVLFEFDSAVVRAQYVNLLRAKGAVLERNESVGLRLEGHTDDRGTDEVNYSLGRERALAVREVLADEGIDVGRLAYVSRGRSQPKDTARNDAARERNRRVEFFITDDTDRYLVIDTVTVVMVEADTTLGLEATTLADTIVVLRTGANRVGRSR